MFVKTRVAAPIDPVLDGDVWPPQPGVGGED